MRLRSWLEPLFCVLACLLGSSQVLGCCTFSAPRYHGPVSDHFDGAEFQNQVRAEKNRVGAFFRWQLTADKGEWNDVVDPALGPPPPKRVDGGKLRATWVGHATVLLQMDGLNMLTDPVWSERVGPVSFAGPTRVHAPAIRFEDLPPIHAVVISHNHYDHLDMPTVMRLERSHRPHFFVGLGNSALLKRAGVTNVTELDWWQRADFAGINIQSVPVRHFSRRGLCDRDATLWTGYALHGSAGMVYFAGDTGFGPHFAEVRQRLGPPRLAILPIGAYLPRWFMAPVHISPAEAVRAHRALGATSSMGVHFDTFPLGDEAQHQAPRDLRKALDAAGVGRDRFWVPRFGEGRDMSR